MQPSQPLPLPKVPADLRPVSAWIAGFGVRMRELSPRIQNRAVVATLCPVEITSVHVQAENDVISTGHA